MFALWNFKKQNFKGFSPRNLSDCRGYLGDWLFEAHIQIMKNVNKYLLFLILILTNCFMFSRMASLKSGFWLRSNSSITNKTRLVASLKSIFVSSFGEKSPSGNNVWNPSCRVSIPWSVTKFWSYNSGISFKKTLNISLKVECWLEAVLQTM